MSALSLPPELPRSIVAKIGGTNDKGCWLWKAAKTNGYGVVQHKGRVQRAHRVVFEVLGGVLVDGLECDHLCRVRACVNPAHLEQVTTAENIRRGVAPSALHAKQTHCLKGHEFTAENTYQRRRGGKVERFCRECCRQRDRKRYAKRKAGAA